MNFPCIINKTLFIMQGKSKGVEDYFEFLQKK